VSEELLQAGVKSMKGYQDLKVWQLGIEISIAIYRLTDAFPQREVYGLTSQLRRAATSIPSNIAEGHSRGQTKDLLRFLSISRGSIAEVETQLIIAERLQYVHATQVQLIRDMLDEESRMLAGLRRSLQSKLPRRM
jgi:four helix bundle protein